jgi:predicted enzyme related to lactoylglutathione lyase
VHFEIIGADPKRLRDYYGELFGWEFDTSDVVAESVSGAGNYGFVQNPDGAGIPGGVGGGAGYLGRVLCYVGVPDVEAAPREAERLGGVRTMGPDQDPVARWSSAISPTLKATSSASREPNRKERKREALEADPRRAGSSSHPRQRRYRRPLSRPRRRRCPTIRS